MRRSIKQVKNLRESIHDLICARGRRRDGSTQRDFETGSDLHALPLRSLTYCERRASVLGKKTSMTSLGILVAVVNSVVVFVGHRVMSKRPKLGLFVSGALASILDAFASSLAPRVVVAPIGALVVLWHSLSSSHPDFIAIAGLALGVGLVSLSVVGLVEHEILTLAVFAPIVCCVLHVVFDAPWSLGLFGSTAGPFVASFVRGRHSADLVMALAVAIRQGVDYSRVVADGVRSSPSYVAASTTGGVVSALLAFGNRPSHPLALLTGCFVVGLAAARLGKRPVTVEKHTPMTSKPENG